MNGRGAAGTPAWRLVATAGMASYLDAGALVATGLVIGGFYVDPLGLSRGTVGVLLGLQTLAFAAGALVGGRLGDRWGRRRVLLASLVLYALGTGVLAAAGTPTALAVGVLLSGLAIGGDLPASLAMIGEEAPGGSRGRMVALTQLLWVAGIATAALLGLALADLGALAGRLLYAYLTAVAAVVLLLRTQLPESREWQEATTVGREPGDGSRRPPFPTRAACVLGGYYVAWLVGANTLGQFRPYIWVETMGGSPRGASALILLGLPLGIAGALLFLRAADRPSRHGWVLLGGVAHLSGWVLVSIWPGRTSFVALCVLFAVGASASGEVAYKIWVQHHVPTLYRATVQGATLAVARTIAAAVASATPVAVGWNARVFFIAVALAAAAALVVSQRHVPRLEEV